MKPITADNNDGRVLLALRAGEMTPGELSERGLYFHAWLIKAGYVVQSDSYYRITEAGRAACPFRNPLAATVVAPARMENIMKLSRVDVLAAIAAAGPNGITKNALVAKFDHLVPEAAITSHLVQLKKDGAIDNTSHLVQLKKDGAIDNPSLGRWVAVDNGVAAAELEKAISVAHTDLHNILEQLSGDASAMQQVRNAAAPRADDLMPAMAELAVKEETIEIGEIQDRRTPVLIDSPEITVFGIFSSGELEITEGFHCIKLTAPVVAKLRCFLGLFGEVA